MTTHPDTLVALYPGDRFSGKTTRLVEQVAQAAQEGQTVAVVVPGPPECRNIDIRIHEKLDAFSSIVICFTEATFALGRSRGLRLDHVFVDDADRFQDSPADVINHFHPGVPITMTYTPHDVRR